MKLSDFFKTDYVDHASYDNLRKISSLVDGQKNASRKILYTILEKNINKKNGKNKVSQLGSKVSEFSEYLHGSLENVIVNLAQDYVGTNNIPLLQKKGNFGTRFSPEASAPRYIYTYGSAEFFELFNKQDSPVLKHQTFEGSPIEPMFYVPSIPILLVNGSEGVSSGFAQKILPRNIDTIKQFIKCSLSGKPLPKLVPWYCGFRGAIKPGDNNGQWLISGIVERLSSNKVLITELPIGYNLKSYIKVLDDLEDKKVIQKYSDKSENDIFRFEVSVPSKLLNLWDDDTLMAKLKLVKTVTENYTVLDENNKIVVHQSAEAIFKHFIHVKLDYVLLRKQHMLKEQEADIRLDYSKFLFIKAITDEELIINKRKKQAIIVDLDGYEHIIKRDGSYDYLLSMNLFSLTEERMNVLETGIKEKKAALEVLRITSTEALWLNDV